MKASFIRTYSRLAVSEIVEDIDRGIDGRERHLGNYAVFGCAASTALVHHAWTQNNCQREPSTVLFACVLELTYRSHIPVRSPPPIQDRNAPICRSGVDAELDDAKRTRAADEDIASAIALPWSGTFRSHEGIHILRIVHLGSCHCSQGRDWKQRMETHGDKGLQSRATEPQTTVWFHIRGRRKGNIGGLFIHCMYLVSSEHTVVAFQTGRRRRIDITAAHLQAHGISMEIS